MRRERPQLLFSNTTGMPAVLYNGVMSADKQVFTFVEARDYKV